MKTALTLASILLIAPAAMAEPDVTEGLWTYQANATLGIMPVVDAGNYCIDGAQAEASYEELLNDINPNCTVTDGAYTSEAYTFTLTCKGGPDGQLDGKVSVQDNRATFRATGWTGNKSSQLPVIVNASAKKIATDCG